MCALDAFFSSFYFSALSITYSNPHTKACYFIIKHVLCVLVLGSGSFFLSSVSLAFVSLAVGKLYLSLSACTLLLSTSRENIFILYRQRHVIAYTFLHLVASFCHVYVESFRSFRIDSGPSMRDA